jgi:LytS/YehU family sensor histidine kinase
LAIELERFGDRLQLEEAIPPPLLDRQVPHLILQPLVENCIKHGLADTRRRMTIRLSAAPTDEGWMLSVEDDGRGSVEAGAPVFGVGLGNVAQRLALLHGTAGRLVARGRPDGGFVASIHLGAPA